MEFANILLEWYAVNKRDLPWRNTDDPYKIWLSEIILQQTRVAQGLPYYVRFVEEFPKIEDLAKADEQKVLKLWQGLGYYSRARNLHFAAKQILELGSFPNNSKEIKKLKGVGDYTSAAIASFAFNEDITLVDGNVYRVVSRYLDINKPINESDSYKFYNSLVQELKGNLHASIFNQAVMEFGALHCLPKNPDCANCVFRTSCLSSNGNWVNRPVKLNKLKKKNQNFVYLVISQKDKVAIEKRTSGIWKEMYQYPLIESGKDLNNENIIELIGEHLKNESFKVKKISNIYKHVLTHINIKACFVEVSLSKKRMQQYKFINLRELEELPIPRLIEKYIEDSYM